MICCHSSDAPRQAGKSITSARVGGLVLVLLMGVNLYAPARQVSAGFWWGNVGVVVSELTTCFESVRAAETLARAGLAYSGSKPFMTCWMNRALVPAS